MREFVENKTHSKIKDIEHGPYKEKLEFIIIDFIILGQGTRSMLKSICYTFIHRATPRIRAERKQDVYFTVIVVLSRDILARYTFIHRALARPR